MRDVLVVWPLVCAGLLAGCGPFGIIGGTEGPVVTVAAEPEVKPEEPKEVEKPLYIPEFAPLTALTARAETVRGKRLREPYRLPQERVGLARWLEERRPIALLEEAGELALYGVIREGRETAILQWGETAAEFDWVLRDGPWLYQWDVDGDGEEEAVIRYQADSAAASMERLHIVKKGEDGGLTDYGFPDLLWRETLPKAVKLWKLEDRVLAALGDELVDLTYYLPEDLNRGDIRDFAPGGVCHFAVSTRDTGERALTLEAALALGGRYVSEDLYVAWVSASVTCQDGAFALQGIHLESYGNGYR